MEDVTKEASNKTVRDKYERHNAQPTDPIKKLRIGKGAPCRHPRPITFPSVIEKIHRKADRLQI